MASSIAWWLVTSEEVVVSFNNKNCDIKDHLGMYGYSVNGVFLVHHSLMSPLSGGEEDNGKHLDSLYITFVLSWYKHISVVPASKDTLWNLHYYY